MQDCTLKIEKVWEVPELSIQNDVTHLAHSLDLRHDTDWSFAPIFFTFLLPTHLMYSTPPLSTTSQRPTLFFFRNTKFEMAVKKNKEKI